MHNIMSIVATEHGGRSLIRSIPINIHVLDDNTSDFDIRSAVEKAVCDYLCTPEGKRVYDYNCESFNWGDFEANVPNEICQKYGFEKIEPVANILEVDWDEQLADGAALADFWHKDEDE